MTSITFSSKEDGKGQSGKDIHDLFDVYKKEVNIVINYHVSERLINSLFKVYTPRRYLGRCFSKEFHTSN